MSGDLDDDTLAEIATGFLIERRFVTMMCDEGTIGFWNDVVPITMPDGVTYQGLGRLGVFSPIPSTLDFSISAVTTTLSGLDDTVIDDFLTMSWHLRPVVLRSWLFDQSLNTAFDSPLFEFWGLMDKATRTGGDKTPGSIVLSIEDASRRSTVTNLSIRSDGDQRMRLSTDGSFQGVASVGRADLYWGMRQPNRHSNPITIHGYPPMKP